MLVEVLIPDKILNSHNTQGNSIPSHKSYSATLSLLQNSMAVMILTT
jgi:hypothetical protein